MNELLSWLPKWPNEEVQPDTNDKVIKQLEGRLLQNYIALAQKSSDLEQARFALVHKSIGLERSHAFLGQLQEHNLMLKGQTAQSHNGFVVVLIDADGDDYIFQDRFLNGNEIGGQKAADELHECVETYLQSMNIDVADTNIVVRAYANMSGLHGACVRNGKMSSAANLHLFAQGFNQRRALFDLVDVGAGKERADNKIKECLHFFANNQQCKHIILGVCHDGGYAAYLSDFASTSATRERISLLVNGSMSPQFQRLGFTSPPLRLPSLFASNRKEQTAAASSSLASYAAVLNKTVAKPSSPSKSNTVVPRLPAAGRVLENHQALSSRLKLVRDKNGKRIDKKLNVDPNSMYITALRQNRLCGYYYLRGKCEGSCDNNHTPGPLKAHEYDMLWHLMRQGLCHKVRKGKDCEDPKCIYGHVKG